MNRLPALVCGGLLMAQASAGVLRPHPDNPIWLTDDGARAIYLAGSHTWACRQERGVVGETPDFDYGGFLDMMERHGQNFLRLWAWEHAQWMQFAPAGRLIRYEPLPYARTGPGLANDGKPRFDLTQWNDDYFARLRERVVAANDRGIFVAVMFFQGFSVEQKGTRGVDPTKGNPWDGHPYHRANNINGVDGDADGDGEGIETHTLALPEITRLQEAYVAKTLDTLDGIVWEIGNECHPGSVEWHAHLIDFIRRYESTRPKQHLIGMTGSPIKNPDMWASAADWISPMGGDYLKDPPVADGGKLIVVDTDHIAPWDHDPSWVWRNLLRGNHFVLMDGWVDVRMGNPPQPDPAWEPTRQAMGAAVRVADRVGLAALRPHGELASTGYCLADPGREYLVYLPDGGDATLELSGGPFTLTWLDPFTGAERDGGTVEAGRATLTAPGDGAGVGWVRVAP